MIVRQLHGWDYTPKEAIQIQHQLVTSVDTTIPFTIEPGDIVAGVDNSYLRTAAATTAFAAVVVMTWPDCEPIEIRTATRDITFPYVPGLLTFRELPVLIDALAQVETVPDLVFCDGHGIAHPRRIGIASHLGLLIDTPTIGIAKKPFRATFADPGREMGATSPLMMGDEQVGFAVHTSARRKHPVFVSPGHNIRLDDIVAPVLEASNGEFLPKPQQAAHNEVTRLRAEAREE